MAFNNVSLKKHVVINSIFAVSMLAAVTIGSLPTDSGIFNTFIIGRIFLVLGTILMIPALIFVSLPSFLFMGYLVLIPFIIYYIYLFAKVMYNVLYLKNKVNKWHLVVIFICVVITFMISLILIEDSINDMRRIMSV